MSTTQEVREYFRMHRNEKIDTAGIRDALAIDDAQKAALAMNQLHANGEIQREKKSTGAGYQYWMPADDSRGPSSPAVAAAAIAKTRSAKSGRGPKQSGVAKPPKEKKAKRKYTRRAHAQAQAALPAISPSSSAEWIGSAVFAIRHDGQLGIDNDGHAIALPRPEVQRLQEFLKTVSPLWS